MPGNPPPIKEKALESEKLPQPFNQPCALSFMSFFPLGPLKVSEPPLSCNHPVRIFTVNAASGKAGRTSQNKPAPVRAHVHMKASEPCCSCPTKVLGSSVKATLSGGVSAKCARACACVCVFVCVCAFCERLPAPPKNCGSHVPDSCRWVIYVQVSALAINFISRRQHNMIVKSQSKGGRRWEGENTIPPMDLRSRSH